MAKFKPLQLNECSWRLCLFLPLLSLPPTPTALGFPGFGCLSGDQA